MHDKSEEYQNMRLNAPNNTRELVLECLGQQGAPREQ